jgi:hypothetical protein
VELARRHLVEKPGMDAHATRQMLRDTCDPYPMWLVFGLIGVILIIASRFFPSTGVILITLFCRMMMISAFAEKKPVSSNSLPTT